MSPRNEIPQPEPYRHTFRLDSGAYRLTPEGVARIRSFLFVLKRQRDEAIESGKDTGDESRMPTFNEIIEDIEDGAAVRENNGNLSIWYAATDNFAVEEELVLERFKHFTRESKYRQPYPLYGQL